MGLRQLDPCNNSTHVTTRPKKIDPQNNSTRDPRPRDNSTHKAHDEQEVKAQQPAKDPAEHVRVKTILDNPLLT